MSAPKATCTERVTPPGMAGIGATHRCGNPAKSLSAEGEPRCGIHSEEARARREAKRQAAEQAERERADRWRRSSYRNMMQALTEDEAHAVYDAAMYGATFDSPEALLSALAKLGTVGK